MSVGSTVASGSARGGIYGVWSQQVVSSAQFPHRPGLRIRVVNQYAGNVSGACQVTALIELLKTWFYIAFLMRKPYDHPADQTSITTAVLVGLFSGIIAWQVSVSLAASIGYALLDLAIAALFLYVGLAQMGWLNRFAQAFAAYCGAGVVLNFASIPIFAGMSEDSDPVGTLAVFVLLVWSLTVIAHIVRHTFDLSLPVGVLVAFVYYVVTTLLFELAGNLAGMV